MQTVGIKALKTNPSALSEAFDSQDTILITRRGEPIGIAAPFDERLLDLGFTRWIAIRAFQAGDLSLGQVAKAFGKSKQETLPLLANLGIAVADYDLDEDLETIRMLDGD
jgi:predicted HTH domain antitoxin